MFSLEPPRRGGSNEYSRSMFSSKNKKNNIYPCKPQFYYIKVGFMGVKIIQVCFRNVEHRWLVYHGRFELTFESLEILPISQENKFLWTFKTKFSCFSMKIHIVCTNECTQHTTSIIIYKKSSTDLPKLSPFVSCPCAMIKP